jgi:hypothetical protein
VWGHTLRSRGYKPLDKVNTIVRGSPGGSWPERPRGNRCLSASIEVAKSVHGQQEPVRSGSNAQKSTLGLFSPPDCCGAEARWESWLAMPIGFALCCQSSSKSDPSGCPTVLSWLPYAGRF